MIAYSESRDGIHWEKPKLGRESVHIRRFTVRPDGFVSVHAGYTGGVFVTQPVRFSGDELELNHSTSASGSLRDALQRCDADLFDETGTAG